MERIDITPTWSGTLGAIIAVIRNGKPEGRKGAIEELKRMAKGADLFNEMHAVFTNAEDRIKGGETIVDSYNTLVQDANSIFEKVN